MIRNERIGRAAALVAGAVLAGCALMPEPSSAPGAAAPAAAPPPQQPAPPYYSIQLATAKGAAAARAQLARVADAPHARAEKRRSGYLVRVGAWRTRGEAESQLAQYREGFGQDVRVLQLENPVDWLLPDGSTLPAYGTPAAAAAPAAAAIPQPVAAAPGVATPPVADLPAPPAYQNAARALDAAVRQRLRGRGAARADGYLYGMDVAPLLLYAALAGDGALYGELLPLAQQLIVLGDDDPYARGFVLRRAKGGAKPEASSATAAMWMARALWAGARAFQRDADRDLARTVLDGYAKHAYELQGVWLVRSTFDFATRAFAGLSVPADYHVDFLAETEAAVGRATWKGFAERASALLERTRAPSGLLYPVIQPEVGATYPGLGVEVYAPNGIAAVADSCAGAEGALRGQPMLARGVLDHAVAHGGRGGRLPAFAGADDGKSRGDAPLAPEGYACLARIAAALGDRPALEGLDARLTGAMQEARQGALAPAGPLLLAAYLRGALKPAG